MLTVASDTPHDSPSGERPSSEAVASELQPLVLATLVDHGPLMADEVERRLKRRRTHVRAALRALEAEATAYRGKDGRWRAFEVRERPGTAFGEASAAGSSGAPNGSALPATAARAAQAIDQAVAQAFEAVEIGTDPTPRYVGGECPDSTHCSHWKRRAAGSWSCEACHPREVAE